MAMFIMCDCLYISFFWAAPLFFPRNWSCISLPGTAAQASEADGTSLLHWAAMRNDAPCWPKPRSHCFVFFEKPWVPIRISWTSALKKNGCGEIHHSVSKNTTGSVIFPTLPQSFERVCRNMLGRIMRKPTSLVKQSHMRTMVRTNMRTHIYLQNWVTTKNTHIYIWGHSCWRENRPAPCGPWFAGWAVQPPKKSQ